MPWFEAQGDCQKRGGNLAVISSSAENDIVYGIVGSETHRTWIGLSNYGQVDNSLQWVTSGIYIFSENFSPKIFFDGILTKKNRISPEKLEF